MLGAHLRKLREQRGHTVRAFASMIDKSPGYISRIEARGEIPSPELLCVIAESLDADLDELLRLAKESQLARAEEDIEKKQATALALFRKQRR